MKFFTLEDEKKNIHKFSVLGLGTWQFGGLNFLYGKDSGWQNVNDVDLEKAVLFAIENGVNFFDTADSYGDGKSEKLIGYIVFRNKLKDIKIISKLGFIKNNYENAYHPENLARQFDRSLKNLKRDYVDILFFHNTDFGKNNEYLDDAIDFFYKQKEKGKVLFIGLSSYTTRDFVKFIQKIKPDIVEGKANIINRNFITDGNVLPTILKKNNIKFLAFSPFEHGLFFKNKDEMDFLSGDHRRNIKKFSYDYLRKIDIFFDKILKNFDLNKNVDNIIDICLDFLFFNKNITGVLFGFRNIEQVKSVIKYFTSKSIFKDEKDLKFIEEIKI